MTNTRYNTKRKKWISLAGGILLAAMLHTTTAFAAIEENNWKIPLGQGVTLEKKIQLFDNGYQTIHIITADLNNPVIDLDLLYNRSGFQNRATLTELASQNPNVVGAVNGDFFSMSDPSFSLGPMMQHAKLLANPAYQSSTYAAFLEDASKMIQLAYLDGAVTLTNLSQGKELSLSAVNKPSTGYKDPVAFTTEYMGQTPGEDPSHPGMTEVLIDGNTVQEVRVGQMPASIPANGYAVVACGEKGVQLKNLFSKGDSVDLKTALNRYPETQLAIGGGSILIQNYSATPITKTVKNNAPRTAVAITGENKLMLLVIDGENLQIGMNEEAVQQYLLSLGVKDALMLDGGGSTEMVIGGKIQNKIGTQRRLLNGLAVVNKEMRGPLASLGVTVLRNTAVQDEAIPLFIQGMDSAGNPVNAEGITVDAVGFSGNWDGTVFTPTSGGNGQLMVSANGITASVDMQVVGKNTADPRMTDATAITPQWIVFSGTADPSGKNVLANAMVAKLGTKVGDSRKAVFFGSEDTVLVQNLQGKNLQLKDGGVERQDDTVLLCINPDKDLTALSGQWSTLQSSIQGPEKNLILFLTKPLGLSKEGRDFWHKMLQQAGNQKNIVVISQGDGWNQYALGTVSYLTVPAMSQAKASSLMDYKALVLGDNGSGLQYSFSSIYTMP